MDIFILVLVLSLAFLVSLEEGWKAFKSSTVNWYNVRRVLAGTFSLAVLIALTIEEIL